MLIRFAIFNGVLMPRLLSEEEYDTEIDHCDFALDELERDILERPGRGHQRPGLVKRPTTLDVFNWNYINAMLQSIAFTPVRLIVSRNGIDLISNYRSNKIRTVALLLREKVIGVGEVCLR